jgi:hypothetical protein
MISHQVRPDQMERFQAQERSHFVQQCFSSVYVSSNPFAVYGATAVQCTRILAVKHLCLNGTRSSIYWKHDPSMCIDNGRAGMHAAQQLNGLQLRPNGRQRRGFHEQVS